LHQQQHPLSRSYSFGTLLESEHREFDTSYDDGFYDGEEEIITSIFKLQNHDDSKPFSLEGEPMTFGNILQEIGSAESLGRDGWINR
jgi:hypothetical protein